MRLRCYDCGKSVSTEVDDSTVVRALLRCPECIERRGEGNGEDERLLLHPVEAAVRLAVSRSRVYGMLKRGELPYVTLGKYRMIPVKQLDAWVDAHTERDGA